MNPVDCLLVHPAVDGVVMDGLGPCRLVGDGDSDLLILWKNRIVSSTVVVTVIDATVFIVE